LIHSKPDYDARFCAKVLEALEDLQAAHPHDEVKARFAKRRAAALRKAKEPDR
jgi:DNA-damage-inducible protein J